MFDEQQFDERVFDVQVFDLPEPLQPNKCSTGTLPLCGRVGYIYYRLPRCVVFWLFGRVVLLVGLVCGGCGSEAPREGR